jgi:SCY1-like protein 1
VFSCQPLAAVEQLRRTECIPPALLADYQMLLSSNTGRRLNPAKVIGVLSKGRGHAPLTMCPAVWLSTLTHSLSRDLSLTHKKQVAESKFLNNRLVEVVAFMEAISLKDSAEKV